MSQLERYQREFAEIEGWFLPEAQAAWDFLLLQQAAMGVRGDFIEIGVWQGKSALLGALHLRSDETAILVDIQELRDVEERIKSLAGPRVSSFVGKSSEFRRSRLFQEVSHCRWFHIEGDHSGFSTATDLEIAAHVVGDRGVICVDDFFSPRYPQLTAAVYRFLFATPTFRLFLCGTNKAFMCYAADYALYEGLIRKYLAGHMAGAGLSVTISKSSYAHDMGCFSIIARDKDRDLLGRDEDIDEIVF